MIINTNIPVNKTQKEYYQKFVNLSVKEEPLPQGDGMIRISPFDDYFLFTLFDEVKGEDTPIDLSNVGDIFINFIGTTDEIDVKNHTQVAEVDLSQGEVLFKITKSDSKKIIALDNACNKDNKELVNSASEDSLTIQSLQNSNDELTNELALLSADLSSTQIELVNRNAKEAQRLAELNKTKKQQIRAINENAVVAQTGAIKPEFYIQAAKNLQNFTTDANPVSTPISTNNGRGRGNFQKEIDDGFDQF